VRLGLVSYRDSTSDPGNVRQVYPLTDAVGDRFRDMNGWRVFGGGDPPEDELYALAGDLSPQMGWDTPPSDRKAVRAIVVITDAPAKRPDNGRDFAGTTLESIGALAAGQRTQIHTIVVARSDLAVADGRALAGATGVPFSRVTLSGMWRTRWWPAAWPPFEDHPTTGR
jgi:hypothetical protein